MKYLHFWGHRPRPDGRLGASCLSQWWPAPFTVDGVSYATAEHWMMAGKARLFGDAEAERAVPAARASRPRRRRRGGWCAGSTRRSGPGSGTAIVVEGSVHKFGAHPELRAYLLGTGDRVLVEASPVDRMWGIGLAADDAAAADPSGGGG